MIIVDDGSTDNTAEVVAKYGNRIKYVRTKNGGCGAARNCGVKEATKPLVTFLDSDDEWMPDHNPVLRSVMDARPELVFCFTNFAKRFRDGSVRHFAIESHHNQSPDWSEIVGPPCRLSSFMALPGGIRDYVCHETDSLYKSLCGNSYISADTLIVRREAAGKSLWFAEDTKVAEELECGARLAATGKGLYIHYESTLVHHHHGEQLVNHTGLDMATSRIVVMQRIWGTDHNFLQHHRTHYEQRLRAERIVRVGAFLVQGRAQEARQEIANTDQVPYSFKLLARLPGGLTRGLLSVRRSLRSVFKSVGMLGFLVPAEGYLDIADQLSVGYLAPQLSKLPALSLIIGF